MRHALADLLAEQDYEATKVDDIVDRAAVSRKTLYDNFSGKEEILLTALDEAVGELAQQVESACGAASGGWPDRVEAALGALLGFFAERPGVAKMCMIEAPAATPASRRLYEEAVGRFAEILRTAAPEDSELPDTTEETLVGGVAWVVYRQVREGETQRLHDLLTELSGFVCAPYER